MTTTTPTTMDGRLEEAIELIESEALNELIHDVFSQQASALNNAGRADQLEYLRGYWNDDERLLQNLKEYEI